MSIEIRNAALFAVQRLWYRHGDSVPFAAIQEGFEFEGERIPFQSRFEGVYKPAIMHDGALSLRSTLASSYSDERISDDRVWYDFSPHESRNDWIRQCLAARLPLIYFLQVKPKPGVEYLIFAPVEVLEEDSANRRFLIDLSPTLYDGSRDKRTPDRLLERQYGTSVVSRRLFQAHFRRAVLDAYHNRCSICQLRERPLLDGAHLVPDREDLGEPVVSNGLALCAIHHRALDRAMIGVTPELTIHVFRERMSFPDDEPAEILTAYHGGSLSVPTVASDRPSPDLVQWRWEQALHPTTVHPRTTMR